jgi:hypothetical protein
MLAPLRIPTRSNPGRYTHDGAARLINAYVEDAGPDSKSPTPIFASDGLLPFATLPNGGPCRGLLAMPGYGLAVSGGGIYRFDPSGAAAAQIGGILGAGRVYMVRNEAVPAQVAIVGEGQRYVYDGTSVQPISTPNLPAPNSVDYMDNYVLYGIDDGRFFWSALNDLTNINALNFAAAQASPDNLRRLFVKNREIWLLKERTTEVWYDAGDPTSPFQRLPGGVIQTGCGGAQTVAMLRDQLYFLDHTGRVVLCPQYFPERISTHAVERTIAATADWSAIDAFAYSTRGHDWYVLNGPNWTWVYDGSSGNWHEQSSQGYGRRRWSQYAFVNGQHIVGDAQSNVLYRIDPTAYDDAGTGLPMTVQIPVQIYPKRLRISVIRLDQIPGVGLNSTNPELANPLVTLSMSIDGGLTFGPERAFPAGKIGERLRRIKSFRWGTTEEDGAVLKVGCSAAVARGFTGGAIEFDVLDS